MSLLSLPGSFDSYAAEQLLLQILKHMLLRGNAAVVGCNVLRGRLCVKVIHTALPQCFDFMFGTEADSCCGNVLAAGI